VVSNVLADGMGFWGFIFKPGVFHHIPPRTFEGGLELWGFLRAAKSYLVEDKSFGLVGYGCRVETTGDNIIVFPEDGLRKRVRLVAQKIDLEALAGEIKSFEFNKKDGSLRLEMTDSTGLVKKARLVVRGLKRGRYQISQGKAVESQVVKDVLTIEFTLNQAEEISIGGL